MTAQIDWDALLTLARKHRVLPLLYVRLKEQSRQIEIPEAILSQLQQAYLQSAANSMRLYHQLTNVLHELQAREIPVIILKGAYLAEAVYNNIALRPMVDIDLLVKLADAAKASKCLLDLGYHPSHSSRLEAHLAFGVHLPPFVHSEKIAIEIHLRLVEPDSPLSINPEELWRQAQSVSIADCQVYGLAPEHLTLHLCIHATYGHNLAGGLLPFCDLTALFDRYRQTLDWEQLLRTARQWNAEKPLYLGFYFARKLFRAAVPNAIIQAIQPTDVTPQWIDRLQARLFNPGEQFPTHLVKLVGAKGIHKKLIMTWKRMFLSPAEMGCLYDIAPNSPAIYLRYPHRIWGQLKRYTLTVWRLARQDTELTAAGEQEYAFREWLTTVNRTSGNIR